MSLSSPPKLIASKISNFECAADEISKGFRARPHKGAPSPFESSWGFFKRESYHLIRKTKDSPGGHNIIKYIVRNHDIEPARLNYRSNEFHWGLLAIDPDRDILDRRQITRFAQQMAYAELHGVYADQLIGFLFQSGSTASLSKKLRKNEREPWIIRG